MQERRIAGDLRIALVGDRNDAHVSHRAIPLAIQLAAREVAVAVVAEWVGTERIVSDTVLAGYDALWVVPASPYRSTDGALRAIRYARETRIPFLGTCGGFQHAVLEYARTVLGWPEAAHAELDPSSAHAVIAPLACSLVEVRGDVRFEPGSRLAIAYGRTESTEDYHCSFGVAPRMHTALARGPLRVTARDLEGDVRGVELDGHPFFVATLFQPERAGLEGRVPPVVAALLRAAAVAEAPRAGHPMSVEIPA